MIRVGAVNIDVSHPKAFAEYLAAGRRARYVAVYNEGFRGDDEVDAFIEKFGLERRCESLEELAQMVDIGFIHACNWNKHLQMALPFVAAGKPVFIDKPVVGSIGDCARLEELSKDGATIIGGSSVAYAEEISDCLLAEQRSRARILQVLGVTGVDEFNYGTHVVEGLQSFVQSPALSSRFLGRVSYDDVACESYYVRYENGMGSVYNLVPGPWRPFDFDVISTKETRHIRIDHTKVYGAMLDRICNLMEGKGRELAGIDQLVNSVKVMLAGKMSRERDGVEVELTSIPENDPGFDGDTFERHYAAAADKIYL